MCVSPIPCPIDQYQLRKTSNWPASFHHPWSDADWKTTWWKLEEQFTKSFYILGLFWHLCTTEANVVVLLHSGVYVSNSIPVSGAVTVTVSLSLCVWVCDCEDHWVALSRPTVSVCALVLLNSAEDGHLGHKEARTPSFWDGQLVGLVHGHFTNATTTSGQPACCQISPLLQHWWTSVLKGNCWCTHLMLDKQ